mmetsp:Transcript_21045/g.58792  ORF Transcript_21045/g.58792 Transcript_21045/m.58792 type:complete len:216 (+) Transcript_21045:738-1385(+)
MSGDALLHEQDTAEGSGPEPRLQAILLVDESLLKVFKPRERCGDCSPEVRQLCLKLLGPQGPVILSISTTHAQERECGIFRLLPGHCQGTQRLIPRLDQGVQRRVTCPAMRVRTPRLHGRRMQRRPEGLVCSGNGRLHLGHNRMDAQGPSSGRARRHAAEKCGCHQVWLPVALRHHTSRDCPRHVYWAHLWDCLITMVAVGSHLLFAGGGHHIDV